MNRRTFLQRSTQLTLAATVASFANTAKAAGTDAGFSLDVVTDRPDRAIDLMQDVFRRSSIGNRTVSFSEFRLPGRHVSDMALVRGQHLIDVHRAADAFSQRFADAARMLDMPRSVDDPTLLRFNVLEGPSRPAFINVYSGDVLMAHLPVGEDVDGRRFETHRGHVRVSVKDGRASIVDASCRHKTCMEMGGIHRPGQSLTCIPVQISVSVEGRGSVDSISF